MAITSKVDVCNLSASLLNVPPMLSIDNPTTDTEETFALWYDQVRKEALRRHAWNFAIKREILSPSATNPPFGYEKAFPLPSDYIRLVQVNETDGFNDQPMRQNRYSVENGELLIGQTSGSSSSQLRLVYVSDFKSVAQMDASFIDYFAHLLAQKTAYTVTQSNVTVERVDALMEKAEIRARAMDGQESPPRRIERSATRGARTNRGRVRNFDGYIVFD